jgi:hypothetical protein
MSNASENKFKRVAKNGQSRNMGNMRHKTQNEDKQNKKNNSQELIRWRTWIQSYIRVVWKNNVIFNLYN